MTTKEKFKIEVKVRVQKSPFRPSTFHFAEALVSAYGSTASKARRRAVAAALRQLATEMEAKA